jgi:O-antigen ligase
MPPFLALLLWLACLLALLRFDPAREPGISAGLWVPVIWLFLVASRLPSQWLGGVGQSAQALEEGNSLDRSVFSLLMLIAIVILMSRSFNWAELFSHNFALVAFVFFGLVSVLWSDFPAITLKRWCRDIGNYLMVLVVVSDTRLLGAVRSLLRRLCYLIIPLSVLIVKYYPALGMQYDGWNMASYVGATTSKNMLGLACLISGMFFFWDTVTRWPNRPERRVKRIILVNTAFVAMTLWLLNLSHSATSQLCLALGVLIIMAVHSNVFRRRLGVLKAVIPAVFIIYVVMAFGFGVGINGTIAEAVGRDPTLTDRTKIWAVLLAIDTDPVLGAGYETFWLGPRLMRVWQAGFGRINEAHNGYLQIYLNLGLIGLFLLIVFLFTGYRIICRRLDAGSSLGSLSLALWTALVFYNNTEAAFPGGLLWLAVLPGSIAVPLAPRRRVRICDDPASGLPTELTGLSSSPLHHYRS